MRRIISLILMLTLLASVFALASCAVREDTLDSGASNVTDKAENSKDPNDNTLPQMDFEGYTVKFAVSPVKNENKTSLAYMSCDADEIDGNAIASSVYQRNRKVEKLLNVKIEVVYASQGEEFRSTIKSSVNSGKSEYDVVMVDQGGLSLAKDGYIMNLELLDDCCIDVNSDWWDTDYINGMRYANEVFWLAGPLSLTHAGELCCFFVNMDMYNAKLRDTYGDIYDMVRSGKWTFENMSKMCAVVYDPVNPSAVYDSDEDVMGLRVTKSMTKALVVGTGAQMSSKKADGTGVDFTLITKNKEFSDMIDVLYKNINKSFDDGIVNGYTYDTIDQFVAEKQLFQGGTLTDIVKILEKASFEIGIIPNPMLNEEQKEYRTSVYGTAQIIGVVDRCQNTEATTTTLEYMARLTDTMVEDVFYREILSEKYAADQNVAEMVELLKDSRYTDFFMSYESEILEAYSLDICIMQNAGQIIYSLIDRWNRSLKEFLADYLPRTLAGA